jgi:pSer/pThr/pTyr-binding forkhead associated (FHA) protein
MTYLLLQGKIMRYLLLSNTDKTYMMVVHGKPVVFGRDPSKCAIQLLSPQASRIHAEIKWVTDPDDATKGTLILIDKSSQGTFLEGVRVPNGQPITLADGQTISFPGGVAAVVSATLPMAAVQAQVNRTAQETTPGDDFQHTYLA